MLLDVCQHTISVRMLKHTYLAFIIFATPGWFICSGRAYVGTTSLGTMMEGKFGTELLVVDIGVGMIFWHLEGMTVESDEVDGNGMLLLAAASVDGNSSPWVTPAMCTWGDTTIIVASVIAE